MKEKNENELSVPNRFQKVQKVSSSTVQLAVGVIMTIIGVLAIIITVYFHVAINFANEKCDFKIDNVFLNVIFTCVGLALLYGFYKLAPRINKKILLVIMLAFSLMIGFGWVNRIEFKPISDQSLVIYCGEKFVENDLPTILNPR